jgi:transcriptional regulator with XRE-family HTH domain
MTDDRRYQSASFNYRAEHELSQSELARRLGMRQPHIARWRQVNTSPRSRRRWTLVDAKKIDIDRTPG